MHQWVRADLAAEDLHNIRQMVLMLWQIGVQHLIYREGREPGTQPLAVELSK